MLKNERTAILLLAAGQASRMGQSKQLLPFRGKPLVRHTAQLSQDAGLGPVLVVLGAYAEPCKEALASLPIDIFVHEDWSEGMGSSVAAGMKQLLRLYPDLQEVVIWPADQPFVTKEHLRILREKKRATSKNIVATGYEGIKGAPTLFGKELFPKLVALYGEIGAKKLFREYSSDLIDVPFPAAAFDIDTPEQYQEALRRLNGGNHME